MVFIFRGGRFKLHIPDGFLDAKTLISSAVISAGAIGYAVKQTKKTLNERQVPMLGVMAAFIFAAQMVNFPIAGGTSGHLIGATLAAISFGPWASILIMTSVLLIQGFMFQDGGISALGGNILIMAVVASLVGYGVYKILAGTQASRTRVLISTFIAGWSSTFAASLLATLLIAVSGTVPLNIALAAMAGWHSLIGIGEGLITSFVVAYLAKVKPDMVKHYATNVLPNTMKA